MIYKDGTKNFVKNFSERAKIGGVQGEENFCPRAVSKIAKKFCVNQSASGFCSKKVLTSSSRHHHIELVASLGASPLASAGSFARKLKGFLKSIKSFC